MLSQNLLITISQFFRVGRLKPKCFLNHKPYLAQLNGDPIIIVSLLYREREREQERKEKNDYKVQKVSYNQNSLVENKYFHMRIR